MFIELIKVLNWATPLLYVQINLLEVPTYFENDKLFGSLFL